jgi:hypothetical protein
VWLPRDRHERDLDIAFARYKYRPDLTNTCLTFGLSFVAAGPLADVRSARGLFH